MQAHIRLYVFAASNVPWHVCNELFVNVLRKHGILPTDINIADKVYQDDKDKEKLS